MHIENTEAYGYPTQIVTFPTGLKAIILQQKNSPVVAVQVWVNVGSADEEEHEAGLAHVHEHMLFKGTLKDDLLHRGVGQIAQIIESSGGEINAWTSHDQTVYHVVLSKQYWQTGLDVLADAVQNSAFEKEELSKELEVVLEEIRRGEDMPSSRLHQQLFALSYAQHPYGKPVIGYESIVKGFRQKDVVDFFEKHYVAENMTVVFVGDVSMDEVVAEIQKLWLQVRTKKSIKQMRPQEDFPQKQQSRFFYQDVEETHVAISFPGCAQKSPIKPIADVASVVLSMGDGSRLVQDMQRHNPIVNEVYVSPYSPRDRGIVTVGYTCAPEKTLMAMSTLMQHLKIMTTEKISDEELNRAKSQFLLSQATQRETVEGLARRLGYWWHHSEDLNADKAYHHAIHAVSAEDICLWAQETFHENKMNLVVIHPLEDKTTLQEQKNFEENILKEIHHSWNAYREYAPVHWDRIVPKNKHPLVQEHQKTQSTVKNGITCYTLNHGLRLILEPSKEIPVISLRGAWLGGQRSENKSHNGYIEMAAGLAMQETQRVSVQQLSQRLESIGVGMSGFSGKNSQGVRALFLQQSFDEGLQWMRELLFEPGFSENECQVHKRLVLEHIRSKTDHPSTIVFEQFYENLWQKHPYRRSASGDADSISAVEPKILKQLWMERFSLQDSVWSLSGDFDEKQVLDFFNDLPNNLASSWEKPEEEELLVEEKTIHTESVKKQLHLVYGSRGFTLHDDKRAALQVLMGLLGGQGGRLFKQLRDIQSLCYTVSPFHTEGIEKGSAGIYIATSPEKRLEALKGIKNILEQVVHDGISNHELENTKRYLIGHMDIAMQRMSSRAMTRALNMLYGFDVEHHQEELELIKHVTSEDIQSLTYSLFQSQKCITSSVGMLL
jgi:zinc protease